MDLTDTYVDLSLESYIDKLVERYAPSNRILFINPLQFETKSFNLLSAKMKGYYAYPPSGLLFLAASIRPLNIKVEILDLNYEVLRITQETDSFSDDLWITTMNRRIEQSNPSIIGVSCMFTSLHTPFEEVLHYLKGLDKHILLAGGTYVSTDYSRMLDDGLCHFAFVGESENKLPFLLGKLLSLNLSEKPHKGILYSSNGLIKETKGSDTLPDPDYDLREVYDLVPVEKYCEVGSLNPYSRMMGHDEPFCAISMNRGCRGRCTFCSVRTLAGDGIRSRSITSVFEELCFLVKVKGISHIDWLDDDLLADYEKSLVLFKKIRDENLNLHWYAGNGLIATSLDDEMLRVMEASGCIGFKIGIESGNKEVLKKIRKPTSHKKLLELSVRLRKYPTLFVPGNFMIGFPDETFSQMLDTFLFACRMELDWANFYICQPLKGADAFSSFEKIGDERCSSQGQGNFLPSREQKSLEREGIPSGPDIFDLDKTMHVSLVTLKEIWFTFNFVANFINNKNLKEGGRSEKFINWISVAMLAYPYDAGMALFLYLGHCISGNKGESEKYLEKARKLYDESAYWQLRFKQFGLESIIDEKLFDRKKSFDFLRMLRQDKRLNLHETSDIL